MKAAIRAVSRGERYLRRRMANLSDKLGVRGTNALTRYAIRHGLVRDD